MSFSKRLKELREKNSLSREQLAEQLKLSYSTIAKYESGARNPDIEIVKKIAEIFCVSIDYLLGRTDDSKHYLKKLSNLNTQPDIGEQLQLFQTELKNTDHLIFNGEPLTEEDRIALLETMEFGIRLIKKKKQLKDESES